MFNFTTQTVYNSINTSGAKQNLWDNSGASKTPSLRIGNTRFDAADIESIQIKAPSVEQLAEVTFDMADIIPTTQGESTTGRIALYIGLSMNDQSALYTNDFVFKGKPLYIEFPVAYGEGADVVANRVKKIADKYLLFNFGTEKILKVTATITAAIAADAQNNIEAADATGKITFQGVNGYQIIKKAVMQKWDPDATIVDCCTRNGEFIDVITGVPVIYKVTSDVVKTKDGSGKQYYIDADGAETEITSPLVGILPGLEAFGDYNWIIHNLRLPTAANTNFWAPTKEEMPVPGQVYTQFIITICKQRDGIMGEIVGARGTSVTTHVLYVAGDYRTSATPAYTVYGKLNTLKSAAIATKADTVFANPFGTSKNLTD